MRLPVMLPFQYVETKAHTLYALARAGLVRPERPDRTARLLALFLRWGPTPAAGAAAGALRYPDEPGLIDDEGPLTFLQLHRRTNALAHALADRGVGEGHGVAILARNHRYFVESTIALSKLGATALYMNTSFAGPQAQEVLKRERAEAVIYDAEFAEVIDEGTEGHKTKRKRFVGLAGGGDEKPLEGDELIGDLIEEGDPSDVVPPSESGKMTILTSGTTGTPKGASRSSPTSLDPLGGLLSRVPYRARDRIFIVAPLFHAWGLGQLQIGMALQSTYVLQRKFDEEGTLQAIEKHRPDVVAVVPIMMKRILDLPDEVKRGYDTSSVRIVFASGSALPGELANRWMDEFGDNLYNLYGSTEVAWATIATPHDLREAPGTAGKAPYGTRLEILDEKGTPLPRGQVGRIFVGNELVFEGYTGGGSKEVVEGLMSTGDLGRVDEQGRLFVESREDDMIVSGGENVYPGEVEDLLTQHDQIADAAVIGVEDEEFGQRLKAFVVKADGAGLSEDDVKGYVKKHLARYKVPRDVEFIDELPRNPTGKVVKRDLEERQEEGEKEGQEEGEPQKR